MRNDFLLIGQFLDKKSFTKLNILHTLFDFWRFWRDDSLCSTVLYGYVQLFMPFWQCSFDQRFWPWLPNEMPSWYCQTKAVYFMASLKMLELFMMEMTYFFNKQAKRAQLWCAVVRFDFHIQISKKRKFRFSQLG